MTETTAEAMSCQELVELVTAYLEDALSGEERRRFQDHLADCATCQVYVEQIRATIRVAGRVTAEDLSPEAERDLLAAFRSWHG
ncbi:MAG TPA: zf-HC2 domain-containing protein [Gaiellaceae bacterium]|nr:zf-HC2 domain-containing protein [Gaiellaceae bacterium]